MLKLCRFTKVKVLFLVLVYAFNFNLFEFSAAILEKGLSSLWRRGVVVVNASDFQSDGQRFKARLVPSLLCNVSLNKKLCSTLSLFTQVYKWYRRHTAGGNPPMD